MEQIVGTLVGTKCVPLVADMFCLLLERLIFLYLDLNVLGDDAWIS